MSIIQKYVKCVQSNFNYDTGIALTNHIEREHEVTEIFRKNVFKTYLNTEVSLTHTSILKFSWKKHTLKKNVKINFHKFNLEIREHIINHEEDIMNTTEDSPVIKVVSWIVLV